MRTDIYSDTAFRLINSGKSLFVTGKAGTGKTTLLKKVYDRAVINKKNAIVLSPTGVAAKNAQGVTILHLPLSPYLPGYENTELYKLKREEIELVRQLNLIIIDEISMVRCDIFYRNIGTFFYYADRLHSYIITLPHKNNIAWSYTRTEYSHI